MPKNYFWDISVKSEPKSKKIFLVILFINMNKLKQKKKMLFLIKIIINDAVHSRKFKITLKNNKRHLKIYTNKFTKMTLLNLRQNLVGFV
jgi:hypothetical protein